MVYGFFKNEIGKYVNIENIKTFQILLYFVLKDFYTDRNRMRLELKREKCISEKI